MAKNLVNGTNIIIEENSDNINMNLSSTYTTSLNTRLTNIETDIVTRGTYSNSEVIIGKWIDNKPIYRRVFTGDISSQIETGLTNINVVNVYGIVKTANGATMHLPSLRPAYANYNVGFYVSSDFRIVFENGSSAAGTAYVTLEYTKNSD